MRSDRYMTSSSLWLMYTIAMFLATSFLMIWKRVSVSASDRDEVGSSIMMSRAFRVRARPISIICCWPTDRSPAGVLGEMCMSSSARISAARLYRVL